MTSPPSPPNRRRRRIVVTIAVLVLGLGWWFWPRADSRIVGDWNVFAEDDLSRPLFQLALDRNGSFHTSTKTGLPGRSWRVENGELVFGNAMPAWADPIAPYLEPAYERLTGNRIWPSERRWEIVEIHDNEIVLESLPIPTSVIVLKRPVR